mgnify:CR=1 FL=1
MMMPPQPLTKLIEALAMMKAWFVQTNTLRGRVKITVTFSDPDDLYMTIVNIRRRMMVEGDSFREKLADGRGASPMSSLEAELCGMKVVVNTDYVPSPKYTAVYSGKPNHDLF